MGGGRQELSVPVSVEASLSSPLMTGPARRLFGLLGLLPDGAARPPVCPRCGETLPHHPGSGQPIARGTVLPASLISPS